MHVDAGVQPLPPHAGPAMVPRTDLAADLPAHPTFTCLVQGERWSRLTNALGPQQDRPCYPHSCIRRSLRASFVQFSCTCIGEAGPGARPGRRNNQPVSPAQAGAANSGQSHARAPACAGDTGLLAAAAGHLTANPIPKSSKHPQAPSQAPHAQPTLPPPPERPPQLSGSSGTGPASFRRHCPSGQDARSQGRATAR